MKKTILIGGKAGQGINVVAEIISKIITHRGYYVFNYRDYPSLIRGGHNFNVLTFSDKEVGSNESGLDTIIAMDELTSKLHRKELKKGGEVISYEKYKDYGRNQNVAQATAYLKTLGVAKSEIKKVVKDRFNTKESIDAVDGAYLSSEKKESLSHIKRNVSLLSGTQGVVKGALDSNLQLYFAYPMTPATGVLHGLAERQNNNLMVFEGENEIGCISMALGASFSGALCMTGTSGGGFDLMSESLSMQGMSEIPLTVYLCARPGPGSGVPTYSAQGDLDIALKAGHGEFLRVVVAPGDAKEAALKTNEALFLSEKCGVLSIVLSDKHLAESQFSFAEVVRGRLKVKLSRDLAHKKIVKASSYESNSKGNSTEDAKIIERNSKARLEKSRRVKDYIEKHLEMVKVYGKKSSKNLVIGWGSTKWAIIDAIEGLDCKFLQILYAKPFPKEVEKEIKKAENVILVENNLTAQMGRLLREETGFEVKEANKILRYDARPFLSDELSGEIKKRLKK